jgi:AraC-like DNA-binding protein
MPSYPRALHQPPTGRPRWINEAEAGLSLQYLAWGARAYGRHPIPISQHAGWTYQLLVDGRATLSLGEKPVSLTAGTLAVVGPGCPCGWSARKVDERCRIVAWIWREEPLLPSIRPPTDNWRVFRLSPSAVKNIEALHRETRHEISRMDSATELAIQSIKSRLDVTLSRLRPPDPALSTMEDQLEYAQKWLLQHPEILSPVSPLCDILKISPASLNRLFRKNLGRSVREVAYANRMSAAQSLVLENQLSIKEIALRFGYSQANDFTRAFSRFWGSPPSETQK